MINIVTVSVSSSPRVGVSASSAEVIVENQNAIVIVEKGRELYTGGYIVTPRAEKETILETKEKTMTDNVTVKKIPFYETSNLRGGYTAYIADNLED